MKLHFFPTKKYFQISSNHVMNKVTFPISGIALLTLHIKALLNYCCALRGTIKGPVFATNVWLIVVYLFLGYNVVISLHPHVCTIYFTLRNKFFVCLRQNHHNMILWVPKLKDFVFIFVYIAVWGRSSCLNNSSLSNRSLRLSHACLGRSVWSGWVAITYLLRGSESTL